MLRGSLFRYTLVCGLVLATGAAAAQATLQEVVVTARKVSERAADAPLVVDVVAADRLVTGDVDGLDSLAARLPGLSFESLWGGLGSAPVLRGLSQPSTAGDNVGVFVDGVYQASRSSINVDPLDLERIEVARGPQSALFGQSTFAGAIHYVPRAPTQAPEAGLRLDLGSGAQTGVQAYLSGPLGGSAWRGRVAAGRRDADGTFEDAVDGQSLGGYRRASLAVTLERGDATTWSLRAAARRGEGHFEHPATSTLQGIDYDCGARDPVTGYWSYRCGALPLAARFTVSPEVPDSHQRVSQIAVRLASPEGPWRVEAEASVYDAFSVTDRDFDGARGGIVLGVCRTGLTCGGAVPLRGPVERLVAVDVLSEQDQRSEQWSEEVRVSRAVPGARQRWTLGLAASQVRERSVTAFALDRRVIGAGEQLTALLPATPLQVGPISQFNRTLVADPARDRAITSVALNERDMVAMFGSWEFEPTASLTLRAELRASRERERLDGVVANSSPGIGRAIPAQAFEDLTPRVSVAWRHSVRTMAWSSLARGSRSGGINTIPGLDPAEQGFGPESNWTWETGLRHAREDDRRGLRAVQLVGFYVDWRDTHLVGFATTPGIANLITRNTAGIVSRGIEASLDYAPTDVLAIDLALSVAEPRFRAGSEDLGSRVFCGLGVAATSTLCTIGPTRDPTAAGSPLVPWIDGNRPQRTPERMAALGLTLSSPWRPFEGGLRLRLDAAWQDDVYDRAINGARYGARTRVDLRLSWARGPWSIDLWGRNLGDDRYLTSVGARGAGFFPTTPRPLDLLYGEGRRYGLSAGWRWATAAR